MLSKRNTLTGLALCASALTIATALPMLQEYPVPTEHHEMVLAGAGNWEGTMTAFMPGSDAEPVAAKDTVEGIGPFWVQSTFECEFMGMPYTGTGCLGYDSSKEKYVGTWVDSMSTHLAIMEGEYDEASDTLVMTWKAPGMTGEMETHRSETVRSENAYTMTFYMGEGDAAVKSMVIDMQRKGAKPVEAGAGR